MYLCQFVVSSLLKRFPRGKFFSFVIAPLKKGNKLEVRKNLPCGKRSENLLSVSNALQSLLTHLCLMESSTSLFGKVHFLVKGCLNCFLVL